MRFSTKCVTVRCLIVIILFMALAFIWQVIQVSRYYDLIKKNTKTCSGDACPVIINKNPCDEVVHVGVVCTGYKSNVYFHTMLKSIFFHRNSSLHFHIMVNEASENILKTLFETWAMPQVNVNFYNINNTVSDVRWVPNRHYSGIYGLLKLTFPKIISLNITNKIIVIDTDLTFAGNIYELWNLFDNFNEKQAIGLVENQSKYYLGKLGIKRPWPALGKGFNTGVMLYHLDRMRAVNWDNLWSNIANETAAAFGKAYLADQDVMNAVIKRNSDLVYSLPCEWNTQLSYFTESRSCYSHNKAKIIHWNTNKKVNVNRKDWNEFKETYAKFNEYDGSLLNRQLDHCIKISENITQKPYDVGACTEFKKSQTHQWRTLLFFRDFKYTPTTDDVTFIAQLSYDRLPIVEELSKLWDGPISVTFYITDTQLQNCQNFIGNSKVLRKRLNIAYHAVFKEGDFYPINELRNIGLRTVVTPYVFLVDIDFLPTRDLYAAIKRHIGNMEKMEKKALIVPAFETRKLKSNKFPQSKENLLKLLNSKTVFPFRFRIWRPGHAPTNYTMWKTADFPYKVNWAPNFEPYVVVQRNVTEYDKRFLGFGWNKVAHIMELKAQKYAFIVLPDTFIIHKSHASSSDVGKFRKSSKYRKCMQIEKQKFIMYLRKRYGRRR